MKKLIIFLLIFTVLMPGAFSQLKKGNVLAGGNASFHSEKYSEATDNVGRLEFAPDFAYLVAQRLALGVKLNFSNYSDEGDSFRQFLFGPLIRYYLLAAASKTNLFAQACFAIGSDKYEGEDGLSKTLFGISAGPAFFLNQFVAIEMALNWNSLKYKDDIGRYNTIGLAIGFQIYLDCMKKNAAQ